MRRGRELWIEEGEGERSGGKKGDDEIESSLIQEILLIVNYCYFLVAVSDVSYQCENIK